MKLEQIEKKPINRELINMLSPQHILLKPQKMEIGDYLSKVQYILGYPSSVNLGWFMNFKDIQNTSIAMIVQPIEDVQAFIEGISKGITTDKNTYNTTQDELTRSIAEFKIQSAQKIIDDMQRNNTLYVKVSIAFKTNGDSEQNLNDNIRYLKNKVASNGLKLRVPSYLTDIALRQCSPFDFSYKQFTQISNKTMSMEALCAGMLFNGSSLIDIEGYYWGTDEDGRMIAPSTFYKGRDRTNSNIVITGASGSGKSFLAKKIMYNEWLNGTKQIVIDPESEYRQLCQKVKGKWIDCSGGNGENVGRINPLQVNKLPEIDIADDNEDYIPSKSALALHLDFLSTFFKLYYPEITSIQTALLMEILEELYLKFGISYETDINKVKNSEFPIMSNLYDLLLEHIKSENVHKKELEEITAIVRGLAIGQHSEIFNGTTTIEFDSSFICLDVYSLQGSSENVKRCQYFNILRYCQEIAFRDRKEKFYIICDEAYLLIDRKVAETIEFLRNFCKRSRKYEAGLIVISQGINDFLSPEIRQYGEALLQNATYKIFFGTDGNDLKEIEELYNLNTEEKTILSQKEKGRGLLFVGSGHMLINVKALQSERPYLIGGGR